MPMYEYWCDACQQHFTKLQRMGTTEAETVCPLCGGNQVRKQISACAIGGGSSGGFPASGPACGMGGGG